MIFYDTETCGLHGMAVLIQWAEDDGPVHLHSVWTEPIEKTLSLIEWLMQNDVCGFNLAFDHFHLCKLYTIFSLVPDKLSIPENMIDEIAELEPFGRDGLCLKPRSACDVMLHAKKGKYQSTMDRRDIVIRKVPSVIVDDVAQTLEDNVKLDDIYFARKADPTAPKWIIVDRKDTDEFKDIVLKFKASGALKNLVEYALKIPRDKILRFGDVAVPKNYYPVELGYAPFAKALTNRTNHWHVDTKIGKKKLHGFAWPKLIWRHIEHWVSNSSARKYAEDDVIYTRMLWKHLGSPGPGDDDSELACMVGAVRWRGFKIDKPGVLKLRHDAKVKAESIATNPNSVKVYLLQVLDPTEAIIVEKSTAKLVLEELSTWENDDGTPHPVSSRAKEVLDARMAAWEVNLYDKLLLAGRLHASMKVIGARSSRMSGTDGLNPQGIKREPYVRNKFPLASDGMVLYGGDFDAFEVVLAIAYYGDKQLEIDVKSGKKIHALFGQHVYPHLTYEQILADKELYTRSKSGVFALIYFGNEHTLKTRLGVPIETAQKAYDKFVEQYPGIGKGREKIIEMFQSMKQAGGIGTSVKWADPADSIESMFGFKRFFTLENQVCKILFNLARKPPKDWRKYKVKVVRRDREQTVSGAVQSALYAAAFAIQGAVTRAAGNHVIQSSGAQVTKKVQRNIWDKQPSGITIWRVQPMNVHDEIVCPIDPVIADDVKKIVDEIVESFRLTVPLISLTWKHLNTWADNK